MTEELSKLADDLGVSAPKLSQIIKWSQVSSQDSPDSYTNRKAKANELAVQLGQLFREGLLMDTQGEHTLICLALDRIVKQSNLVAPAGALKTRGRNAAHRLMRQSLLMDAYSFGFKLNKSRFVRLCTLADPDISVDSAERDYTSAQSDPGLRNLLDRNIPFCLAAKQYGEAIKETKNRYINLVPKTTH